MKHLLIVNPDFRLPTEFSELRALYWGIQRLLNALVDNANMPKTEATETSIEGDGDGFDAMRTVQQAVVNVIRTMPEADLDYRTAILLHWESECGFETPSRVLEVAELLRSLAAPAASLSIAAE